MKKEGVKKVDEIEKENVRGELYLLEGHYL